VLKTIWMEGIMGFAIGIALIRYTWHLNKKRILR